MQTRKRLKKTPLLKPNEETSKITVKVTDGPLNVRTGAGTSYSKILTMEKGETVTVIELENGWAYVDYYGTKGWCSADYLDMN